MCVRVWLPWGKVSYMDSAKAKRNLHLQKLREPLRKIGDVVSSANDWNDWAAPALLDEVGWQRTQLTFKWPTGELTTSTQGRATLLPADKDFYYDVTIWAQCLDNSNTITICLRSSLRVRGL